MVLRFIGRSHQRQRKKKKERLIYKTPPVKCDCGVKSNYGLVPSELAIGYYCGHMVDYDEVGYCCGKHEIIFFFCKELGSNFLFEQSTRKCKWESYDGQAKLLDDLKGRQVLHGRGDMDLSTLTFSLNYT